MIWRRYRFYFTRNWVQCSPVISFRDKVQNDDREICEAVYNMQSSKEFSCNLYPNLFALDFPLGMQIGNELWGQIKHLISRLFTAVILSLGRIIRGGINRGHEKCEQPKS